MGRRSVCRSVRADVARNAESGASYSASPLRSQWELWRRRLRKERLGDFPSGFEAASDTHHDKPAQEECCANDRHAGRRRCDIGRREQNPSESNNEDAHGDNTAAPLDWLVTILHADIVPDRRCSAAERADRRLWRQLTRSVGAPNDTQSRTERRPGRARNIVRSIKAGVGGPIDSHFAHSWMRTIRGARGARRADPCPSPSVEDRCSSACALWVSPDRHFC